MDRLPTLEDLRLDELDSPRVFVRVDFNVAFEDGKLVDDTRIREALPTLGDLLEAGATLVLASHRGRPRGEPDPALSLEPVAGELASRLGRPVAFAADCIGEQRDRALRELDRGDVLLLENLRFHPEEKANDAEFGARLVADCDAYVDDAFGTVHRAHASVVAAARGLPRRAAGRLLVKEVEILGSLLESPQRPFVAVAGGAKISGKIDTLVSLAERIDRLLLGGGMANTFLASQGLELARSLVDREGLDDAHRILARASERGVEIHLPTDVVVTDDLSSTERRIEIVAIDAIPDWGMAVDIGPETVERYRSALADAGSVFWNGPMGVFEQADFSPGSIAVAEAVGGCPGFTVMGGGETAAVAGLAGVTERIDHISTGGGASLELLAGRTLPGVAVLGSQESPTGGS